MTTQEWLVLIGALGLPVSGILGAILTYKSMNKTTKENSAATLINAAHGVSKDLIAQLSSELVRLREQMSITEQIHSAEMMRMSEALEKANTKIETLTAEVSRLTVQQNDYERVLQERDTLLNRLANLSTVPAQRDPLPAS